ncbi:SdpI family protein [candidate division WOR-3 bacterium]|nr:SdpI family protein [candidate division WOR-3 bacterium]
MTKGETAGLVVLGLSVAVAAFFYPRMPALMASHWNAAGEVDGYAPRLFTLLIAPVTVAVLWLVFFAIPRIDPLKKNIAEFRGSFDWLVVVLLLFFLAIGVQVDLWSVNIRVPPQLTMPVALGLLFMILGRIFGKAKRNYLVGIRTPWTIASDVVWEKTHRLGSRLFVAAGGITLLGVFFGRHAMLFMLVPVLAVTAILVLYSYIEYSRLPAH